MSRLRGWILAVLTLSVAVSGVVLLMDVDAATTGESVTEVEEGPGPDKSIRTERITPPGARSRPTPPPPRPRVSGGPGTPTPTPPPTFRLGGIPPVSSEMTGLSGRDEGDLQRQLAERRLRALERRVRAMKRRINSMTERGSSPERIEAQKRRMEALVEEITAKHEELGLPAFDIDAVE